MRFDGYKFYTEIRPDLMNKMRTDLIEEEQVEHILEVYKDWDNDDEASAEKVTLFAPSKQDLFAELATKHGWCLGKGERCGMMMYEFRRKVHTSPPTPILKVTIYLLDSVVFDN